MSDTAQSTRYRARKSGATDTTVTLRVMDGKALSHWTDPAAGTHDNPHCLLYLVALDRPGIRSSQTRRLRLKDSLAGGMASRNAGILARDPHFWDYLQQINLTAYEGEIDAGRARHFINRVCAVSGRYQLDIEDAAKRFFTRVEQPFLDWLQAADCD